MKLKILSTFFFFLILTILYFTKTPEKSFVIVIPSYNNEKYVRWNLNSALNQKYTNYKILYLNDCSTDNTLAEVHKCLDKHSKKEKVQLISNPENYNILKNTYFAIHNYTNKDDIIVILDGDDALAHPHVLQYLNQIYSNPHKEVWLTYGQYQEKYSGNLGFNQPMPEEVVKNNSYRSYVHLPSHLRTFYSWLFQEIKCEDLLNNCNQFYTMSCDTATMIPMIEMCGDRFEFIPDVLYIYNDNNPLSNHRKNHFLQMHLNKTIRLQQPYSILPEKPKITISTGKTHFNIFYLSNDENTSVENKLSSILRQVYDNYCIEYVHTEQLSKQTKEKLQNKLGNKIKFLQSNNPYESILVSSKKMNHEDVIIILNEGDEFIDYRALQYLDELYENPNKTVLFTYGQYINKNSKAIKDILALPKSLIMNKMFDWIPDATFRFCTFKTSLTTDIPIKKYINEKKFTLELFTNARKIHYTPKILLKN